LKILLAKLTVMKVAGVLRHTLTRNQMKPKITTVVFDIWALSVIVIVIIRIVIVIIRIVIKPAKFDHDSRILLCIHNPP
jgi:hypothetical protein